MEKNIMAKRKVPFTKEFKNYEDACKYVRKHIKENGWILNRRISVLVQGVM